MSERADFPIFENNPGLVYLDSSASAQKPRRVIEAISKYLSNDYSNIHRGAYTLSERSEEWYVKSKKVVAEFIGAEHESEIVYGANSTALFNLLSQSLARSGWLKKGDRVILGPAEHHANIVPWLMLKEDIGIEVEFLKLDEKYDVDFLDFQAKFTPNTKVISLSMVSNVTGKIFDIQKIVGATQCGRPDNTCGRPDNTCGRPDNTCGRPDNTCGRPESLNNHPYIILDASQAIPNFEIDVQKLSADFLVFTGHKLYADMGIGVLYGKKDLLKSLTPSIGGGGAINFVKEEGFEFAGLPYRFEPGTPNVSGAVSLLSAIEYIESVGGHSKIESIEKPLISFALSEFAKLAPKVELIGPKTALDRVGIFSFVVENMHANDIAEIFATENIAVRAGRHCTEPLHDMLGQKSTVRMSIGIYTTKEDLMRFFDVLQNIVNLPE